jgi:hypothetical protein
MIFKTPVLLIAWRRSHTTQQVINPIRAVKPTRMFVACDGPHPSRPEEAAKVMATWRMIDPKFHKLLWLFRVQGDKPGQCLGIARFSANLKKPIVSPDTVLTTDPEEPRHHRS